MRTTKAIFILITVGLFFSCKSTTGDSNQNLTETNHKVQDSTIVFDDSTALKTGLDAEKVITKEDKKKKIRERKRKDSLRLNEALNDAWNLAEKNLMKTSFTKQYKFQPDDSSFVINIEILIGDLFSEGQKYFLLRRHLPGATYLNLFKISNGKTSQVFEREQGGMTYIGDTIFDVNGDKKKDFVVHWYPSSGCCRRNVYNVYLNLSSGEFTSDYEFINPTFYASEQLIRGVGYGHPGEVGLYKYRWQGLRIDTVEFIYPDVSNEGQFIKTSTKAYRPTENDGEVLKEVPEEYLEIESYNWFSKY